MNTLSGKTAIITGGASGMGKATALLFAGEGANVVIADLNVKGGEAVEREGSEAGRPHGARVVFQRCDVSSEADVIALVQRAIEEFGRLDIMFNNAGIGGAIGRLENIDVEAWERTQSVCLRGVFLGMKHAIPRLREAGGGVIISTASIAGIDGYPGLHAYSAAKAGVVNLTRSAAIELGADRIRVNCIAPGGITTPIVYGPESNRATVEQMLNGMQPWPSAGQPEDIAHAAMFLASDAARFITGHTLVVDGGATAGPIQMAPKPGENRPPPPRSFAGPSFEQADGLQY